MELKKIELELKSIRRALERITLSTAVRTAYSAAETAKLLGVSSKTVRRMILRGELLTVSIGSRVLIPLSEVERISTPKKASARQHARSLKTSGAAEQARLARLDRLGR